MATIFPREEKAEALFGEILKNPEACHRLMDTFNDSLDMADVLDAPTVSAQQFAAALFNAYENKDLSAFLMAICQHSMFDLLRNAALIPFKFHADGQPNPVSLTDDVGVLLPNNKFAVSSKVYDRFIRVFQKQEKVKMYLASGYCKYHGYDEGSMDVVEYHYNQHLGLLLIYELPDTVKQKVTEAEAYSTVWDIQMKRSTHCPVPWSTMDRTRSRTAEPATMNLAFFCRWNTLPTGWNAMWKLLPRSFTASKRPVNELPL